MARHLLLTCALAAGLLGSASTASACDGCGMGYGWGLGFLYNSLENKVPYFAAHPPVYYSAPVPRAYGWSPFAYPPNVRTPEFVESVQPLTINNPHFQSEPTKAAPQADQTAKATTPEPLVIINPYVEQSRVMQASHSL